MKAVQGTAIYNNRGKIIEFIPTKPSQQPQQQQPKPQPMQQVKQPKPSTKPKPSADPFISSQVDTLVNEINLNVFKRKISNVMRDNMYARTVDGHKSGKLSTSKLYKLFTGSTKLFKRKQERQNKKYSVSLVIDVSGSMRNGKPLESKNQEREKIDKELNALYRLQTGERYGSPEYDKLSGEIHDLQVQQNGCYTSNIATACYLAESTTKAMVSNNVDVQIIAFASYPVLIKDFNEKTKNERELLLKAQDTCGGGTELAPALEQVNNTLRKREGKKILVVISDGGTENVKGSIVEYNKAKTYADVIGISIETNELKQVIPDSIVVKDPEDFVDKFTKELDKKIKRG
jgi:hypothetical protein